MAISTHVQHMVAALSVLTGLSLAFVVLRMHCKLWYNRPFRRDDYTLLAALVGLYMPRPRVAMRTKLTTLSSLSPSPSAS